MTAPEHRQTYTVAIVGGGLGGIACAIALKTQLGFHDFVIYEQAVDFGGTWQANTYPGSACDTPAHWYSLSTHQNPDWSAVMPRQPELLAYWKGLASKCDLYSHAHFSKRVLSCAWDQARGIWILDVEDTGTEERHIEMVQAHAVVSAIGILSEPHVPDVIGLHTFGGPVFHSARWDHSVDFRSKRVAVIGNGASAAQFVPCLVADPSSHVVHFCRTPNWFIYGPRGSYPPLLRWILVHIPLALRLWRFWVVIERLCGPYVLRAWRRLRRRPGGVEDLIEYVRRTAPKKYHERLIPKYALNCRRPVLDPGYLACLHAPNVELVWDEIVEVTPEGVRVRGQDQGEDLDDNRTIPFDVIILGTGFVTGKYPVRVTGRDGVTLEDFYRSQGGQCAYFNVAVPGFPNYFFIGGPNTVTANGSAVYTHEIEVDYIVQLLKPLLYPPSSPRCISPLPILTTVFSSGSSATSPSAAPPRIRALSPRLSAHAAYNAVLQSAMTGGSYASCPPSWFRVGEKNISLYPWSHLCFWWMMRRVRWADWQVEWEAGPERRSIEEEK